MDNGTKRNGQQATAVFLDVAPLRSAVADLVDAGFERHEIGLLAGERTIERALGNFYARATEIDGATEVPSLAFIAKEQKDDTFHGLFGGLFFFGTTTMAGAMVASAAALGGAAIVAASGVAAVGVVGAAAGLAIHKREAEQLKVHLDEGHLVLFVRTRDRERARRALDILSRHSEHEPTIHDVDAMNEGG
jgi:hypothetical protein